MASFSPETSAAYNQSLVLDFGGELDETALKRALQALVDRHDSLRTSFSSDGEYFEVHESKPVELEHVDVSAGGSDAADAWVNAEAAQVFDLEVSPLLRAGLLRLSPDHCRLVLIQPHIVTDGWSMQVLAVELGTLYSSFQKGDDPALPPAPAYRVYADHARNLAAGPEAAAHWRGIYATLPPDLDLPSDRPRPKLQTYSGDSVHHRGTRRVG